MTGDLTTTLERAPCALPVAVLAQRAGMFRFTVEKQLSAMLRDGRAHFIQLSRCERLWRAGPRPSSVPPREEWPDVAHPLAGYEQSPDCAYRHPRPRVPGDQCGRCPDRERCWR